MVQRKCVCNSSSILHASVQHFTHYTILCIGCRCRFVHFMVLLTNMCGKKTVSTCWRSDRKQLKHITAKFLSTHYHHGQTHLFPLHRFLVHSLQNIVNIDNRGTSHCYKYTTFSPGVVDQFRTKTFQIELKMHHVTSVLKSVQTSLTFFGCSPGEPFIWCIKQLKVSCKTNTHGKIHCDGKGLVSSTALTIQGDPMLFLPRISLSETNVVFKPPQPDEKAQQGKTTVTD